MTALASRPLALWMEVGQRISAARAFPLPGLREMPGQRAFHFEYQQPAGRPKDQEIKGMWRMRSSDQPFSTATTNT